jgi:FkbM family methyltransferase
MKKASVLMKAISWSYRARWLRRGAGRLVDAIPVRLLGGHQVLKETEVGSLLLSTEDHGCRELLLYGASHERAETRMMEHLLHSARGFIDVGASYGWYTRLAVSAMPPGSAQLAVEAHPEVFECLRRSFANFPTVTTLQAAATSQPGPLPFHCSASSDLSSTVRNVGLEVLINGIRLDDVWPDTSLDLIKCDVEGGELDVLIGSRLLRTAWNPIWLLELDLRLLGETGVSIDSLSAEFGDALCFYRLGETWQESHSLADAATVERHDQNVFMVPTQKIEEFRIALKRVSEPILK